MSWDGANDVVRTVLSSGVVVTAVFGLVTSVRRRDSVRSSTPPAARELDRPTRRRMQRAVWRGTPGADPDLRSHEVWLARRLGNISGVYLVLSALITLVQLDDLAFRSPAGLSAALHIVLAVFFASLLVLQLRARRASRRYLATAARTDQPPVDVTG